MPCRCGCGQPSALSPLVRTGLCLQAGQKERLFWHLQQFRRGDREAEPVSQLLEPNLSARLRFDQPPQL